jgi:hypothetical protein
MDTESHIQQRFYLLSGFTPSSPVEKYQRTCLLLLLKHGSTLPVA